MKYFKKFKSNLHCKLCSNCFSSILEMDENLSMNYFGLDYNTKCFANSHKTLYLFFDFNKDKLNTNYNIYRYKQHRRTKVALRCRVSQIDNAYNNLLLRANTSIPSMQYVTDFGCKNCGLYKTVILYDYFNNNKCQ